MFPRGNRGKQPIYYEVAPRFFGDEDYESDEFRMYRYKVKRCPLTRSHDWTMCPFAHRGEVAKRRDPSLYHYEGILCRQHYHDGICVKGKDCPYAHGTFEYWLHPARYRTAACIASTKCDRKVCFFAHNEAELRDELEAKKLHVFRLKANGVYDKNIADSVLADTSHEVVPKTTKMATNRNVANEKRIDFLASLSGLTIYEGDESVIGHFGKYTTGWIADLFK